MARSAAATRPSSTVRVVLDRPAPALALTCFLSYSLLHVCMSDVVVFGQDGQYKAFKKQRNMTDFDKDAYEKQRDQQGEEFYQPTAVRAFAHAEWLHCSLY